MKSYLMQSRITKYDVIFIFFLALCARYLFAIFSGIEPVSGPDWSRYDALSNQILAGNFNLETRLFITAPLFSYVVAALKLVFGPGYGFVLQNIQIVLSSISVVYLMLTAKLIFSDQRIAMLTGITYAIYPITLYFTHQFSQESIFQSIFIISIYYYSMYMADGNMKFLVKFSILFSLALLTKSHIILILPFLVFSLFMKYGMNKKSFLGAFSVMGIVFLVTLPYGIYNKVVNGTYVMASSGLGGHFVTGHNDDFFAYVIDPPPPDSAEFKRLKRLDFDVYRRLAPELAGLSHKQKQARYLEEGILWSIDHPVHFLRLVWFNLKNHLFPGFSVNHYPFKTWLIVLIISTPVFFFAYFEMTRRLVLDYRSHLAIASIFMGMLCFSIGFYSQNRFRVVTIEPFYLMYASSGLFYLLNYFRNKFQINK